MPITPSLILAELVQVPWLPWALVAFALTVCLVVLFVRVNALSAALDELKQRQLTPPPTPPLPPAPIPATPIPAASPPPPQLLTTPTDPNALPDGHLIAIITAAAIAALGRPVVVRRLTFLDQNTVSGWAEAGRLMIQTSHNMIRKG